ncbi:MAG: smalltalk protein [Prevotella sp.]|nr:smalltalk protein [Prevotella sp.]MBR1463856.1 smalltalk protein [Prevotella sp.]
MKKETWELIIKLVIAVASAILGTLGAVSCSLWF